MSGLAVACCITLVLLQVLLVGGATRMPSFLRFVENMMGLEPKLGVVNPDEVRAVGL